MEYPFISEEDVTPSVFRAATLILESIERHMLSLDYAASTLFSRKKIKPLERMVAYRLAWSTLLSFAPADLLLKRAGYRGLPMRRVNAFRVAYTLVRRHGFSYSKVSSIRGGLLGNRLLALLKSRLLSSLSDEIRGFPAPLRIAYEYTLPPRVTSTLVKYLGLSRAKRVAAAFSRRRTWVRPATGESLDRLQFFLERRGIRYRRDRDYDFLFEVIVKPWEPLPRIPSHLGVYQDKASVAVVEALAQRAGGTVWDAAAAPLLKSSLLCSRGKVEVVATDVSERRLRSARVNVSSCNGVYPVVADSTLPPLRCCFPGILVDAPCTNSGAINRDPGLRLALWGIGEDVVRGYAEVQRGILIAAAERLAERGVLAYSTCSIFPEEGEFVVRGMSGFAPLRLGEHFPGECGYEGSCEYRRLFPDKEGTAAFFVALLEKRG